MDTGSLTYAQIWVRAVHAKVGQAQTNKSAQELHRRDRNCLLPCPARGSNPGSSDLNFDPLPPNYSPSFSIHDTMESFGAEWNGMTGEGSCEAVVRPTPGFERGNPLIELVNSVSCDNPPWLPLWEECIPPKTECSCLHGGVIGNGQRRNPPTLCSGPVLVLVQSGTFKIKHPFQIL